MAHFKPWHTFKETLPAKRFEAVLPRVTDCTGSSMPEYNKYEVTQRHLFCCDMLKDSLLRCYSLKQFFLLGWIQVCAG